MAWVRKRRRKGGVYYYVVGKDGASRAAGQDAELAREAAAELTRREARRRLGLEIPKVSSNWTLKMLRDADLADFERRGMASLPSRRRRWEVILAALGPTLPLSAIDGQAVERFTAARLRVAGPGTVGNDRSVLSSALDLARRLGVFDADPFRQARRLQVPSSARRRHVAYPEADVARLIEAGWARAEASGREADVQAAAIVEIAYLTGSRISQVLGLRWEQAKGGVLRFEAQKGGAGREWALRGRLATLLRRLPKRGPWVFPAESWSGHREEIRRFLRIVSKAAGLPRVRPHELRHSHATAALYRGEAPPAVSARLGHKSTQMVHRTYGHIFRTLLEPLEPRATGKTAGRARPARATSEGSEGTISRRQKRPKPLETR